jgi:predicted tellurium resistance membrane protein TerC
MEIFLSPETWLALLTLTSLEIILGVDNVIFISIVTNKATLKIIAMASPVRRANFC